MLACVRFSKSPSWQSEYMWTVLHPKSPTRKRGVDEEGVIGPVGSVRPMDVSEDVQHWLHPLYSGEKLVAPFVTIGAGSRVEDAIGRAVCHENVGVGRDARVELRSDRIRDNSKGFSKERRGRRAPELQPHDLYAFVDQ